MEVQFEMFGELPLFVLGLVLRSGRERFGAKRARGVRFVVPGGFNLVKAVTIRDKLKHHIKVGIFASPF